MSPLLTKAERPTERRKKTRKHERGKEGKNQFFSLLLFLFRLPLIVSKFTFVCLALFPWQKRNVKRNSALTSDLVNCMENSLLLFSFSFFLRLLCCCLTKKNTSSGDLCRLDLFLDQSKCCACAAYITTERIVLSFPSLFLYSIGTSLSHFASNFQAFSGYSIRIAKRRALYLTNTYVCLCVWCLCRCCFLHIYIESLNFMCLAVRAYKLWQINAFIFIKFREREQHKNI